MIFIRSTIDQALSCKYDGIDLDWEGQSRVDEMTNLGQLIVDFRAEIRRRGLNLLLTAAVFYRATVPWGADNLRFPVGDMNANLDWVNVISYDINLPQYNGVTKPHAALMSSVPIVHYGSAGLLSWIDEGLSPTKIVFGLPFYGHACELVEARNYAGIFAPIIGRDTSTFGASTVSYDRLRTFIEQQGATHQHDPNYVTDYCYKGQIWVSYDDIRSISTKIRYAKTNALRGYFAWCLHQDRNWDLSREASEAWDEHD